MGQLDMHDPRLAFPKGQTRQEAKTARRKAKDDALAAAYAVVDARDQNVCRATLRTVRPQSTDARNAREHHHLLTRLAHPELRHDPDNIVTVCREVHQLIGSGHILVEGTDASKRLIFRWNPEHYRDGKRPPFELASKRRSQRRTEDSDADV